MRPLHLLSAALLLSFAASPAAAQVLFGRVTDAGDGAPVAAVQVTALDSAGATAAWALSGRDGGALPLHLQQWSISRERPLY